ncbi:putative transmembrane anti-sigma factor [Caballeronia sordidicola]|uniref:Putative transmembrane anti-sigma factor n=1 Tax=Caballeronia sordidicola TaxID=196367 RepID=A0A158FV58_CABSO|nr:anti-sigma factor [Caballeronia sordidicola]SAL23501.1 putative transmembrane anti-sigma factor [Caballeronia sordidicola]
METNHDVSLAEKLRDGSLYERAPSSLHAQVRARLNEQYKKKQRFSWNWSMRSAGLLFAGGGVTGACACALIFLSVMFFQRPAGTAAIEQEIVASHVRALMSSRTMDVLSSDQHTVKPWFNGRIDYAPPVVDPQAQGFPLVGGRLDYVDHRPVAVMIYRYLKHPIDLYVFPDSGGHTAVPTAMAAQSSEGYSLIKWRQNGMVFWAITDASPIYLKRFADAVVAGIQ